MIKAIEVNVKKSIVIIIILLLIGLAILAQNRQKPFVDKHECVGCKDCVEACPVQAIEIVEEKAEIADTLCIDCKACVKTCPQSAIRTPK